MPIQFFKYMTEEADVQEIADGKLLSPDMNRKGDRVGTEESARKGEA
jgi:hypothetical protein